MPFKKGQRVVHPRMPEWGLGQVLENSSLASVRVFFVGAGERLISLEHVTLQLVTGEAARHSLLDNLGPIDSGKGARYLSLPRAVERFMELFPKGFYGDRYLEEERNYKVKAQATAVEALAKGALEGLIGEGKCDEVCRRALRVVSATNLIFPNEKMALKDGLQEQASKESFASALHVLLYAPSPFESRFTAFAEVLESIGAAKWTTATYFPFLVFPNEHMFVKPTVTQKAAELSAFEINYRPSLNWITYDCVLRFSKYLFKELEDLKPRDMIDVQSFMWCIAPEI